ncbi:F-box protein CPR30-like isoform X1 [Chenopodium quinoa]|uniref:F-box protein CPR30-like isoform X1 n=1 Tax=Chenopodium quinoa TaxID=63459 RepID=UPI000B7985F6|nr:F-box protein CPR30-like isoform X1 [Chenopodium quinoa]
MWYFGDKVLARGVMHWISFSLDERPLRTNYTHIVSFDFGSETFSYTELPGDRWSDKDKFTWPFRLGDQFAVLDVARASVCIWVLKKCGGSRMEAWSKWYHTTDSGTYKFFLKHKAVKNLIYIESIHKFLLEVNGVVKSYDLESHKMKNLEVTDCHYVMDPYVESLLLCEGLNDRVFNKNNGVGWFWLSSRGKNGTTFEAEFCGLVLLMEGD